jgi:hypothetical protein
MFRLHACLSDNRIYQQHQSEREDAGTFAIFIAIRHPAHVQLLKVATRCNLVEGMARHDVYAVRMLGLGHVMLRYCLACFMAEYPGADRAQKKARLL